MLSHSTFSLLFVYFFLFVTSLVTFSFLVATFFSKAKLAGDRQPCSSSWQSFRSFSLWLTVEFRFGLLQASWARSCCSCA